ncbi:MAG: response regulator transcription factor [Bacteroidales bacterium]|jgi:two-component system OmpR family response regulator|nr:response regulator transcription factor [Bacteroidales bacterium]
MENKHHIFLVEDDENFGSVLKSYLEMNNFNVTWFKDGADAIANFTTQKFDFCILDIMLPNVDGFTVAKKIKQLNPEIPTIFLTAKTLKDDVLQGYKIGADDYITKPFDSEVLLYKIKAIIKRNSEPTDDSHNFSIGKYRFNSELRTLRIKDNSVKLSPKESELLQMLCLHENKILDRDKALNKIWGEDGYFTARSMDVYITKLRKYLKNDPSIEIENIHGSGFILKITKTE